MTPTLRIEDELHSSYIHINASAHSQIPITDFCERLLQHAPLKSRFYLKKIEEVWNREGRQQVKRMDEGEREMYRITQRPGGHVYQQILIWAEKPAFPTIHHHYLPHLPHRPHRLPLPLSTPHSLCLIPAPIPGNQAGDPTNNSPSSIHLGVVQVLAMWIVSHTYSHVHTCRPG